MTLLALDNITKAYGGAPALRGVSLTVEPGEIHALMGENGAGKSTLIKILAGVVMPDTANIAIDGKAVTIDSPAQAHRLGLRFIHQEFNVVPALSVAENLFLGRPYPRRWGGLIDWPRLNATARATLERLGISHIDPAAPLSRLSLGDQMLVRISSAFLDEGGAPARLYVLDEPTAALSRSESQALFKVLAGIKASGCSILYVSHRLDEIMTICDRATVLRDGTSIDSGRLAEITHDDLVAMMIGRPVGQAYPAPAAAPGSAEMLRIADLSLGAEPFGLTVRAGEILGVAGLANAGQTKLLRTLFGDRASRARITLSGQPYRPRSPADAWRAGVAYVPAERRSEGLMLTRPIFENATLPHLAAQSLGGTWLTPGRERAATRTAGERVRLKARGPDQLAGTLSGGNQQKVVFARALAGNPRLLLLDEPTRGVDIGAKFDIYTLIRDMAAKGMGVILVSSDLPELLGMADRIAVLRGGALIGLHEAAALDQERLLNLCYGRAPAEPAATES